MPDSCSNPKCGVSHSRCPVCERNFVSQDQEVCASCHPWFCESCGKESKHAYTKRKSPIEVASEIRGLMGYGSTIAKCRSCNQIKAIGDMEVCRECAFKKINETELVCAVCLKEDGSHWSPESKEEGECRDCGESKLLNEEFLCKSCHDKMHLKQMTVSTEVKRCWNCQEKFQAFYKDEKFCKNCKKTCYGCKGKFDPENKKDIFCEECKSRMDEGQCTQCYDYTDTADERGHCYNCASPIGREFCVTCDVNEVSRLGEQCDECEGHLKLCPRCLGVEIYNYEYICNSCKINDWKTTNSSRSNQNVNR